MRAPVLIAVSSGTFGARASLEQPTVAEVLAEVSVVCDRTVCDLDDKELAPSFWLLVAATSNVVAGLAALSPEDRLALYAAVYAHNARRALVEAAFAALVDANTETAVANTTDAKTPLFRVMPDTPAFSMPHAAIFAKFWPAFHVAWSPRTDLERFSRTPAGASCPRANACVDDALRLEMLWSEFGNAAYKRPALVAALATGAETLEAELDGANSVTVNFDKPDFYGPGWSCSDLFQAIGCRLDACRYLQYRARIVSNSSHAMVAAARACAGAFSNDDSPARYAFLALVAENLPETSSADLCAKRFERLTASWAAPVGAAGQVYRRLTRLFSDISATTQTYTDVGALIVDHARGQRLVRDEASLEVFAGLQCAAERILADEYMLAYLKLKGDVSASSSDRQMWYLRFIAHAQSPATITQLYRLIEEEFVAENSCRITEWPDARSRVAYCDARSKMAYSDFAAHLGQKVCTMLRASDRVGLETLLALAHPAVGGLGLYLALTDNLYSVKYVGTFAYNPALEPVVLEILARFVAVYANDPRHLNSAECSDAAIPAHIWGLLLLERMENAHKYSSDTIKWFTLCRKSGSRLYDLLGGFIAAFLDTRQCSPRVFAAVYDYAAAAATPEGLAQLRAFLYRHVIAGGQRELLEILNRTGDVPKFGEYRVCKLIAGSKFMLRFITTQLARAWLESAQNLFGDNSEALNKQALQRFFLNNCGSPHFVPEFGASFLPLLAKMDDYSRGALYEKLIKRFFETGAGAAAEYFWQHLTFPGLLRNLWFLARPRDITWSPALAQFCERRAREHAGLRLPPRVPTVLVLAAQHDCAQAYEHFELDFNSGEILKPANAGYAAYQRLLCRRKPECLQAIADAGLVSLEEIETARTRLQPKTYGEYWHWME